VLPVFCCELCINFGRIMGFNYNGGFPTLSCTHRHKVYIYLFSLKVSRGNREHRESVDFLATDVCEKLQPFMELLIQVVLHYVLLSFS
jgi:hypothetical protein